MPPGSTQRSAAGQKIDARRLTKRYGATTAVHDLSFDARLTDLSTILTKAGASVRPGIAAALPTSIERPVLKFWPTQAGQQIANVVQGPHALSPWAGFGIMCAFAAIVLAAANFSLHRRDA